MPVGAITSYTSYIGNGVQSNFSFPFLVLEAGHLQVYIAGGLTTAYTVTGLGNPAGGNVVLSQPPPNLALVQIYRVLPLDQPTGYATGDPFPALAHQAALDRIVLQLQQHEEALERRVGFARTVVATLRNLALPLPGALKLLGWNAAGDGLTLYDPTLLQVTVDPVSGRTTGKTTIIVPTVNLATLLTAVGVFPAGCLALGVTYRCTTTFSNDQGLTGINLGMGGEEERWGSNLARTSATVSTAGAWLNYRPTPCPNLTDVVLTALGGTFGATGACKITGHWETFTPDT